jgi:acetolactate synthase-1/2/3 large subunit
MGSPFPASDPQAGDAGHARLFEANNAMHDCDVMVVKWRAVRRPGDRSPRRLLAGVAEDPYRHDAPSIGKNVRAEVHRDRRRCDRSPSRTWIAVRKDRATNPTSTAAKDWWKQIDQMAGPQGFRLYAPDTKSNRRSTRSSGSTN